MKISQCETIIDLPKFIETHESFIKALKPGKARTAYLTRYNKVKEQLTQKENGTTRNL
jgi:hypothetical protein